MALAVLIFREGFDLTHLLLASSLFFIGCEDPVEDFFEATELYLSVSKYVDIISYAMGLKNLI